MTLSKKIISGLLGAIAASVLTFGAQAAPITIPVGLNPGDTYRLAFVTSTRFSGLGNHRSNIDHYNNLVNNIGLAATGFGGWTVIGSTPGTDARDNTNTNNLTDTGTAIYLLDGVTRVADNNADLWDWTIDAPIDRDENGVSICGAGGCGGIEYEHEWIWTGTGLDGTAVPGAELGASRPAFIVGLPVQDDLWIWSEHAHATQVGRYYAMSGLLTVPENATTIPAPASLLLFGLGLAGIGVARHKRAA